MTPFSATHRFIGFPGILALMVFLSASLGAQRPVAVQIGSLRDGPAAFGAITGAVVVGSRIAILDGRLNRLSLFDTLGRFLSAAGKAGAGPSEFAVPVSVMATGVDSVLVIDAALGRMSTFRIRGDSLTYVGATHVPAGIQAACVLGGRIFVFRPSDSALVHELDRKGQTLASFARPAVTAGEAFTPVLNRGSVHCLPRAGLLIVTLRLRPEVRSFAPSGQPRWSKSLSRFRPVAISVGRQGAIEMRRGSQEGDHAVLSAFETIDSLVVVQLGIMDDIYAASRDYARIEARRLRVIDGAEDGVEVAGPNQVMWSGEWVLSVARSEYPRLQVARERRRSRVP